MERAVQIIVRLYYLYIDKDENLRHVHCTQKFYGKKKLKPSNKLKYGI